MNLLQSIISGLAGATVLTAVHESVRRIRPQDAPRMDVLGERVFAKGLAMTGKTPPPERELYAASLAGDMVSNSLYYSLVGLGDEKDIWLRGAALGAVAGLGAITLPGPMGLGEAPSKRTPQTAMMTVGWYMLGGVAAAAAASMFAKEK